MTALLNRWHHNQQGPFVLQAHYHYLNEMTLDEKFKVRLLVVDHDKKRMHLCLDIYSINMNKVIAVSEKILVNVNLVARKTEPYPLWAYNRLQTLKKTHEKYALPNFYLNHWFEKIIKDKIKANFNNVLLDCCITNSIWR